MVSARDALIQLREGNRRFSQNRLDPGDAGTSRRLALTSGQEPIAILLGCSDSRVPAEIVFDQGLGDLFVIRVAGNIVAPSLVGSIEFAADRFSTRLVVVLGHSQCGAVEATLEELLNPTGHHSPNLRSIVDRIAPAVESLVVNGEQSDLLLDRAVRANVRASVNQLRHGSRILEDLQATSNLFIVGAEYSLETGVVDFFEGVPAEWNIS
jgi:carbonic anhydrase